MSVTDLKKWLLFFQFMLYQIQAFRERVDLMQKFTSADSPSFILFDKIGKNTFLRHQHLFIVHHKLS